MKLFSPKEYFRVASRVKWKYIYLDSLRNRVFCVRGIFFLYLYTKPILKKIPLINWSRLLSHVEITYWNRSVTLWWPVDCKTREKNIAGTCNVPQCHSRHPFRNARVPPNLSQSSLAGIPLEGPIIIIHL